MNLYKITFTHYSPKDAECGINGFVYEHDDLKVLKRLLSRYGAIDLDNELAERNVTQEELLSISSTYTDEEVENSELYYGFTVEHWELVASDVGDDSERAAVLDSLGLLLK